MAIFPGSRLHLREPNRSAASLFVGKNAWQKNGQTRKAPAGKQRGTASVATPAWQGYFTFTAIRETVESIVVAFILAFLFRTFEAEAFVIPTGSMAPTLMGAHKDILCPNCGYRYRAGASSEAEDVAQQRGFHGPVTPISDVTCPLCRLTLDVDPSTAEGRVSHVWRRPDSGQQIQF